MLCRPFSPCLCLYGVINRSVNVVVYQRFICTHTGTPTEKHLFYCFSRPKSKTICSPVPTYCTCFFHFYLNILILYCYWTQITRGDHPGDLLVTGSVQHFSDGLSRDGGWNRTGPSDIVYEINEDIVFFFCYTCYLACDQKINTPFQIFHCLTFKELCPWMTDW